MTVSAGPRVWNKASGRAPADAVYVGRPSPWGNPWTHKPSRVPGVRRAPTRAAAVERYRAWVSTQPAFVEKIRRELRGRDLVCWCAPDACHADVLLEIANSEGPWPPSVPPA